MARRAGVAAGVTAGALLAGGALAAWTATPRAHVAPGCFWWTATAVSDVHDGAAGCLRAYVVRGGLADSGDPASARLSYATLGADCPWRPGDAVVARFRATVDDGRLIVLVTGCR